MSDVEGYARAVAEKMAGVLGADLAAVWLTGSAALGDHIDGVSDIDVIGVAARRLSRPVLEAASTALVEEVRTRPTRLELVLYDAQEVASPTRQPSFQVNLNAGGARPVHVSFDPAEGPTHWFLIDLAIAREHGRSLRGPAPAQLVGPVARSDLLAVLLDSLAWHRAHDPGGPNGVLNACRAWRYAEEGAWSSKSGAATWAAPRLQDPTLVERAVAARSGRRIDLSPVETDGFSDRVERAVRRAGGR